MGIYTLFIKRLLDFFIALIAIILLSPIIILTTVLLVVANQGNPFFIHPRPGKNGKIFKLIKFKTMNDKKDKHGEFLPFDQRVTKVGLFIRKFSLDEIPQLLNVIKGDMSLVGPRPLLVKYLPYYTPEEKRRHHVRPGITGLAQISGRNFLNWDDRLKSDVWYVDNLSSILDLKIVIITIRNVVTSKDVAVNPNLIMQDLDAIRKKN